MSTIEKIQVREKKTLKLNNVLIREIDIQEDDFNTSLHMMDSYIKSKGNTQVGPLVTYSGVKVEGEEIKIILKLMAQLKVPIHNLDVPYKFQSKIKVNNCLFARFKEKEENLQFAYTKLQLFAFENDRKLKGDSYTVFLDNKGEEMTADIFMEEDLSESL